MNDMSRESEKAMFAKEKQGNVIRGAGRGESKTSKNILDLLYDVYDGDPTDRIKKLYGNVSNVSAEGLTELKKQLKNELLTEYNKDKPHAYISNVELFDGDSVRKWTKTGAINKVVDEVLGDSYNDFVKIRKRWKQGEGTLNRFMDE